MCVCCQICIHILNIPIAMVLNQSPELDLIGNLSIKNFPTITAFRSLTFNIQLLTLQLVVYDNYSTRKTKREQNPWNRCNPVWLQPWRYLHRVLAGGLCLTLQHLFAANLANIYRPLCRWLNVACQRVCHWTGSPGKFWCRDLQIVPQILECRL